MQEYVTLCNDLWVTHATALGLGYCLPMLSSSHSMTGKMAKASAVKLGTLFMMHWQLRAKAKVLLIIPMHQA